MKKKKKRYEGEEDGEIGERDTTRMEKRREKKDKDMKWNTRNIGGGRAGQ